MEDHDMQDEFPQSDPDDGKWIFSNAAASTSALDTVSWVATQVPCPALNSLIREAANPSVPHGPPSPLFTPNLSSLTTKSSGSTPTSSSSSYRRRITRTRGFVSTAPDPTKYLPTKVAKIEVLVENVARQVGHNARVKKHYLEKQDKKRENVSSKPPQLQPDPPKRGIVSRVLSEELTDSTNVESRSGKGSGKRRNTSYPIVVKDPQKPWDFSSVGQDANIVGRHSTEDTRSCTPEPLRHIISRPMDMPPPMDPVPATHRITRQLSGSSTHQGTTPIAAHHSELEPRGLMSLSSSAASHTTISAVMPPQEAKLPVPSPHVSVFRASQPTMPRPTPPPLGMRRSHTTGSSSGLVPRGLPTKQAGFKTPFARTASASSTTNTSSTLSAHPHIPFTSGSSISATPTQGRAVPSSVYNPTSTRTATSPAPSHHRPIVLSERSSSPAPPEADSSYGELPFDLDELDEEMKKYD